MTLCQIDTLTRLEQLEFRTLEEQRTLDALCQLSNEEGRGREDQGSDLTAGLTAFYGNENDRG